jgi:hypothetical protein
MFRFLSRPRLSAPAVKTALAKVEELGALVTVLDKGGPQDVDRLFGCGQFAVA